MKARLKSTILSANLVEEIIMTRKCRLALKLSPTDLIINRLVKQKINSGQTTAKMQIDSQNPPARRRLKRNDAIADKPQAGIVSLDAAGKCIVIIRTL